MRYNWNVKTFFWNRHGASTVEYVVLLAGVLALALIFTYFLSGDGQSMVKEKMIAIINGEIGEGSPVGSNAQPPESNSLLSDNKGMDKPTVEGSINPGENPSVSDDDGQGNWLAPLLRAKASIAGKVGYYYFGAHQQGMRLLTVYEGTQKTGYLLTGKPKSLMDKLLRGKYYKEGQVLGLNNSFTTFGKGMLRETRAAGNWVVGIGLAGLTAYDDFKAEGLTTNVAAEFVNEALWNVGTAATGMAVGSAMTGFLGATAVGATLGSSVPIVGTIIGATAGALIGLGLSTPIGQEVKGATKAGFKFLMDKGKEGVDKAIDLGKKGVNKVKSWFGK
jgi:hypothetical protein